MLEHKRLYGVADDVPEGEYYVEFGRARVRREGTHLTIVAWQDMLRRALAAAEHLAAKRGSTSRSSTR